MIAGKHTIELYKKLYNLPTLRQEETVSDSSLFRLYDRRHYFVVIVIYNLKGQCLLIRDFNKNIGWELPGGFIQDEEVIEDSVNRVVLSETGLEVDELCPIAIVENIFKHKNKKISHFGLSFMALSRGKVKNFPSNIQSSFSKNIANKIAFQNEKIVKIARDKLTSKKRQPPFSEIDNIKRNDFSFVHMLHESILKKIGRSSSIKIRDKIFQLVNNHPKTILDVSCGDNSLINELYDKYRPNVCIGNDISWKTISMIKNKREGALFTNHNLLDLPYKIKFDLIIFKNTLHHIDKVDQKQTVLQLKRMSKQLIVVDINDPQNFSLLSKVWNRYYVYLLGDQGDSFLSYGDFKKFILDECKQYTVVSGLINTIKGAYFYASIVD